MCFNVSITPHQTSWRTKLFNMTEPAVECLMLNNVDGSEPKAEETDPQLALYLLCVWGGKPVADD